MKYIYGLTAIVLFALYTFVYRPSDEFHDNKFELAVSFTAKSLCSCLFVSKNSDEQCWDYASLSLASPKLSADHKLQKTKAELFFFIRSEAQFMGEEKGCVLL